MKKLSLLLLIIFLSCTYVPGQNLQSDPTINSIFNKSEIIDLQTVMTFFNNQICTAKDIKRSSINKCYKSYLKRLQKAGVTDTIKINIPFDEQENIYKAINDSTFYQIWNFNKYWKYNSSDTMRGMELYRYGKYAKYLELLGKEYSVIAEYYDDLQACGDISPVMVIEVLLNYKKYNISDINIKLFMAIHYLTLNDQWTREEKY